MTDEELQAEFVLEHYRNPHNYGKVDDASSELTEANPVCGDTVHISIHVDEDRISDIKFIGRGCSISQASASILTDEVKGMTLQEVLDMKEEFLLSVIGIPLGPAREKCALLSLNTLKKAVHNYLDKERGD